MKKFGVKLWSKDFIKNPDFVKQSIKAVDDGYFDYIELFAIPNSYDETSETIKEVLGDRKVIIHAPHSVFGLDTGDKDSYEENCHKFADSQRFADLLNSDIIILHSGMGEGEKYLNETIRQFNMINDRRIAVENLPQHCTSTGKILHGTSPEQVKRIIVETGCKFCLDISHAICASNYFKRDAFKDLVAYNQLNPVMYHLSDADMNSDVDAHMHYGEGNYDLACIVNDYISNDTFITMETGHGVPTSIEPWVKDITYIRNLVR